MTDCIKIEQELGCWTKADGSTENILIVREYGIGANGLAVLARTHYTDVAGDHITLAAGEFVRIGACLACCGDVVLSNVNLPGNRIATVTLANGQTVDLNETITGFTSIYNATNGVLIGQNINEAGEITDVYAPKQSVDVNLTPITYVPTATGNTANLGQLVIDPNGFVWAIDDQGDAVQLTIETGAPVTVGTNPPTGTAIEGAIHLVTDDGTPTGTVLEQYIYDTDSGVWIEMQRNAQDMLRFGTSSPAANGEWDGEEFFVTSDGTHAGTVLEQWIWDKQSSSWIQRPESTGGVAATDEFTAVDGQALFTLTAAPTSDVVWSFRDGIRLPSSAFTVSGNTATYVAAANNGSVLNAGDRITFDYIKAA